MDYHAESLARRKAREAKMAAVPQGVRMPPQGGEGSHDVVAFNPSSGQPRNLSQPHQQHQRTGSTASSIGRSPSGGGGPPQRGSPASSSSMITGSSVPLHPQLVQVQQQQPHSPYATAFSPGSSSDGGVPQDWAAGGGGWGAFPDFLNGASPSPASPRATAADERCARVLPGETDPSFSLFPQEGTEDEGDYFVRPRLQSLSRKVTRRPSTDRFNTAAR